jgi:hypothetical protein
MFGRSQIKIIPSLLHLYAWLDQLVHTKWEPVSTFSNLYSYYLNAKYAVHDARACAPKGKLYFPLC